jgi:hypothetical protein
MNKWVSPAKYRNHSDEMGNISQAVINPNSRYEQCFELPMMT